MKKILVTEAQLKSLTEQLNNYNRFPISALVKQAKNFEDFKDFSHFYSIDICHGYYWHWTTNPDFQLSTNVAPRDMSSMSSGTGANKGAIMLTSDMMHWDAHYNQYEKGKIARPYAVLFDASDIDPKYLKQVGRGFGNEIYLFPQQARELKQLGVYKRDAAKALERRFHNMIPQSEKDLYKIWKFAHGNNSQIKPLMEQHMELKTKDEIFKYLLTLPKKVKIQTKYGDYPHKIYDDGFQTAINYNPITKLYLDALRAQKKTTTLMPVPDNIDTRPYNILNDIIKAVQKFPVEVDNSQTIQVGNMTREQLRKLENGLITAKCQQLMCACLYEDYFNTNFSRGNAHHEALKLRIPTSEDEITNLYKEWTSKKSVVEHLLFFADSDPVIRLIEKE